MKIHAAVLPAALVVGLILSACAATAEETGDLETFCDVWELVAPDVAGARDDEQIVLLRSAPAPIEEEVAVLVAQVDAGGRTTEARERVEAFVASTC